jgi:hypothetical protein
VFFKKPFLNNFLKICHTLWQDVERRICLYLHFITFLFIYILIGYKYNHDSMFIKEGDVMTMLFACLIIAVVYLFISFASYRAVKNVYLRMGLGLILGLVPMIVFVHFEWWFILSSITLTIVIMLLPNIMRRT